MNYTVLVVDDEVGLRRALVEKVDWESAGFRVVGEAENGVEALDLVETLEPDLIITDIRMPMISGLELAERVRQLRPATQMVILSGYDRFEYAKQAIDYHIISYLLKPISCEEMGKELVEIHRRMDEITARVVGEPDPDRENLLHRARVENFLLPLMLGGNETHPDNESLVREAVRLGILKEGTPANRFCVLVSKFKTPSGTCTCARHISMINNIVSAYLPCETFVVYGRAVTLVVLPTNGELSHCLELPLRETVQSARRLFDELCTIGVSREFSGLNDCSEAYFQAVTARRYTSDGAGEIRFIEDQEHNEEFELDRAEKTAADLDQLLKVGEPDDLEAFINSLYERSTPENANLLFMQILSTVYRVVGGITDKSKLAALFGSNPIFNRVTSYSSEAATKGDLIHLCRDAKNVILHSQKRESEVLCDRVVQIIDQNYCDETLSLTGVSNELGVSPNYLSTLIKKVKGKNFITLLTERRMRAAYDMIVCTGMKMLEISEKCGYSDQHYFSYCFKKFYGESPNKIRVAHQGSGEKNVP